MVGNGIRNFREDGTVKLYYTTKNYRQLVKNMVILYDTREAKNNHIIEEFDRQKIEYKKKALQISI